MERQIQALIENLGVTEEQAKEIIVCDKEIDKGKPMPFDLPPEKEKIAKKYRTFGSKVAKSEENKPKVAKTTKISDEKAEIMAKLTDFLEKIEDFDVKIVNSSRELQIFYNDKSFSLTLTQHRGKK